VIPVLRTGISFSVNKTRFSHICGMNGGGLEISIARNRLQGCSAYQLHLRSSIIYQWISLEQEGSIASCSRMLSLEAH
jgi:hypothetical protein